MGLGGAVDPDILGSIPHITLYIVLPCKNLKSNLTMWKLGTLSPVLRLHLRACFPIDPSRHMHGLGYQNSTNMESVKQSAVVHYNGQSNHDCRLALGISNHIGPSMSTSPMML